MLGVILALALATMAPLVLGRPETWAVDQCLLKEELYWCDSDQMSSEEKSKCARDAPGASTRMKAVILPRCLKER